MLVKQPTTSYGNPQKEDGYTPIANELFEAILKADFTKRQLLIIMAIARMTYGYSKKSDALSSVQIANLTGINRPKVSETLRELIDMNVVIKHDSGRQAHGQLVNEISINKLYKSWTLTDTKTVPVDRYQNGTGTKLVTDTEMVPPTGTKLGTQQIPKRDTHKTNKTNKAIVSDFETFWKNYPRKEAKKKAQDYWLKNKPNLNEVLTALQWQIKSDAWLRGFIPLPTSYLNQERWTDEPFKTEKEEPDWKKGML